MLHTTAPDWGQEGIMATQNQGVTTPTPPLKTSQKLRGVNWVTIILVILVVVLAAAVVAVAVWAVTSDNQPATVTGGTPSDPIAGKDDSVQPVLLGGINSWGDVRKYARQHNWYWQALAAAGISRQDVRRSARAEANGKVTKAILVVNSNVSSKRATRLLQAAGYHAGKWPVLRIHNGILNTSLNSSGSWIPFWDLRSQVRATLLVVKTNGKLATNRGVLLHCGNPWRLFRGGEGPTPGPGAKPTPRPTLQPKDWRLFPKEPKTPSGNKTPDPIGTAAPFAPLAPSDPVPADVIDVNPPAQPAIPDSGSGATHTAPPAPDLPEPPAPPPPDPTPDPGIVPSD